MGTVQQLQVIGTRYRYRQGFTLIEIMISVAIGAFIMLLAIMAVRTATDTLRALERHAAINDAIRAGWLALADDGDYWRSHADPSYPYGRGYMQEGVDASGNNTKRPFAEWQVESAAEKARSRGGMLNPAGHGAYILSGHIPAVAGYNSARVPYSGHIAKYDLFTDQDYENFNADRPGNAFPVLARSWRLMSTIWQGPDPLASFPVRRDDLVNIEDEEAFKIDGEDWESYYAHTKDKWNDVRAGDGRLRIPFSLPSGWEPWNIMGDWPALANRESYLGDDEEPQLQAIQYAAFRNLGHHGVASYAPPGAGTLIADPPDNRKNMALWESDYTSAADPHPRTIRQGAVPGALTGEPRDPLSTPDAATDYATGLPGSAMRVPIPPMPVQWHIFADDTRFHHFWRDDQPMRNMDSLGLIASYGQYVDRDTPWRTTTPASNLNSSNLPFIMLDYDRATGVSLGHQEEPASPHGFIYANRIDNDGTDWSFDVMLDDFYRDPQRRLWSDRVVGLTVAGSSVNWQRDRNFYVGRSKRQMLTPHIAWTDHIPTAPTDALIAPEPLPDENIRMRTGIVRWRQSGRDRGLGWVHVIDPADRDITLSLPVSTTTFRGAREQWKRDENAK